MANKRTEALALDALQDLSPEQKKMYPKRIYSGLKNVGYYRGLTIQKDNLYYYFCYAHNDNFAKPIGTVDEVEKKGIKKSCEDFYKKNYKDLWGIPDEQFRLQF